ncbi:MAG TPA: transcription-repair coupling factor [bacterium]|nr:transcription-repair coupling factor [bacterium]
MDFGKSKELKRVLDDLKKGKKEVKISGLWGSAKALLLSSLSKKLSRSILVLTSDEEERIEMEEDLRIFGVFRPILRYRNFNKQKTGQAKRAVILSFPSDGVDKRLSCLSHLLSSPEFLLVTDQDALKKRIISPDDFLKFSHRIRINEDLKRERFIKGLVSSGYEGTPMIERRGEFSTRGGIIDIWSPQDEHPLRIELFGERIESLRKFDPITQRSIKKIKEAQIIPAICQGRSTFLDYLPKNTLIAVQDTTYQLISAEGGSASGGNLLTNQLIYFLPFPQEEAIDFATKPMENFHRKISLLRERIEEWQKENYRIFIFADNQGQRERYLELLKDLEKLEIKVGSLSAGFLAPELRLAILTDEEIFGRYGERKYLEKFRYREGAPISAFLELEEGDYVVHQDYGIGIYEGLKRLKAGGGEMDFSSLRYAGGDRLYIPIDKSHLVSKYIGTEGYRPKVYRLGGVSWERVKERIKERVRELAEELLNLYASRKAFRGHSFPRDDHWQMEFDSAFIYPETPDQARTIEEIKRDMEDPHPMDRLICGDVGYGKTEIAMRATFKAVTDGKQVALLTPTTILAEQHYRTFRDRFADWPVRIEMLSRFRTKTEQQRIVKDLKKGLVDIVIGTHRLIQKDVNFKDLGLVIIDEEQRFGVRHKEKLKNLRRLVDVLTLSATPIPRTLHLSLSGIWDMSLVNTPPEGRLPIATYVTECDEGIVREAIKSELLRKGQIYFVHNRIENIPDLAKNLKKIFPGVRIAMAHGQMPERELEEVMAKFIRKEIDILVSTVIVESGLDIPNVNTLIVKDAQDFGLSQLYQLRGRVGRGRSKAHAYFFYPKGYPLSSVQIKRLATISRFTELGSGFKIAMKDLEIRGAGNILGPEQSGYIMEVGFDLYSKLLEEAVERLKGKEPTPPLLSPKITMDLKAYFPQEYIPDQARRIAFYQRMASSVKEEEIKDLGEELKDRFGPLPEETRNLIEVMNLKVLAQRLGIVEITKEKEKIGLKWRSREEVPKNIKNLIKGKICQEENEVSFLLKRKSIRTLSNVLQKLL